MAFTQAEIDALDRAIAKGERVVTFADRSVTYRSLEEMLQSRAMMLTELARAAVPPRPRQWVGWSRKAF